MRKKIMIVLALSIMAAVALVGCGTKKSNSEKKTEETIKESSTTKEESTTPKDSNQETTTKKEGSQETTTLKTEETSAEGATKSESKEYTDDELMKMAMDYYQRHNNYKPGFCAIDGATSDGKVTIQLYDLVDDHNSTCAWYEIDRKTATGKDTILDTDVDLKN